MNTEIIAVGSELLLGQIVNTNARFISSKLAELGIGVYFHTVVGDNAKRLLSAIQVAETRADIIIFTGGLGPTKDDLTKETIADYLKVDLVFHDEAIQHIEDHYKRVGRVMTENNRKQALVFDGADVLPNQHGMAPGIVLRKNNKTYMLLPGPPSEMEPMFANFAAPYLAKLANETNTIHSRVLRFFGIGESVLETKISDLLENQTNPTIAPLASDGEVTLRITAKADFESAMQMLAAVEKSIIERVGEFFYGYDSTTLIEKCVHLLKQKGLTVTAAESLTGGLFQQEITSCAGASEIFSGGMVTYSNDVKHQNLGVRESTIRQFGAVSGECAEEMAICVREKFQADIGVSFTGVAGPDELEGKPVGTVFIGFSFKDGDSFVKQLKLGRIRSMNRVSAVKNALYCLIKHLEK